ncbi:MAG: DUF418 domain-containing protein [Tannerellaceae bacterium]
MKEGIIVSIQKERITVIDALRGFALLGVILIHMVQHYGIFSGPRAVLYPQVDSIVSWIAANLIMGRFINIFAFLFGLSFFIQMDRAKQKGVDFRKRFVWRMFILFLIGVIGNLFYTGDILSIYACFGVLMVWLYRYKNKVLLVLVAFLLLGGPRFIISGYERINASMAGVQKTAPIAPSFRAQEGEPIKPSFIRSAKQNLTTGLEGKMKYQFGVNGRGYLTLALFILGLVIGRLRYFEELERYRKTNIRLALGGVGVTILIGVMRNWLPEIPRLFMRPPNSVTSFSDILLLTINDLYLLTFSAALALIFIVLYQQKSTGRLLQMLVPYGKMGLTNYEIQSVIGALLFSMWSLGSIFGSWGATQVFVLGIVVYIVQLILSKYWLRYFIYGPFEWLWRSATYLKWQPLFKKNSMHKKELDMQGLNLKVDSEIIETNEPVKG